ncbi:hypothetical protein Tco_0548101 [Tanacetum coccineum]
MTNTCRTSLSSQAVNKSPTHYQCEFAKTFRVILFSIHNDEWKSFQCHHQTALRIHKDGDGDALLQLKSDSLTLLKLKLTKTFFHKHHDLKNYECSRIKDKDFRTNLGIQDLPSKIISYQGEIVAKLQMMQSYEYGGQDTGFKWLKTIQDGKDKDLKISDEKRRSAYVFTNRWRLDELAYGTPSDGPYQTNLPSIEDIILSIRINRDGQVRHIRHEEEIDVIEYQVLTHEIKPTLKPLEEIIWENIFCLGGNRDHVLACLCYMLYCVVHSKRFNLAYFMTKRIEWVTKKERLILPYGMLLTRLFKFIIRENPELENESYVLYDRVMTPLSAQLEQKPRRDRGMRRGCHSTSSSSAFDQPSSSHLNDDDGDGNDEGTPRASTPSLIRYVNSLANQVPKVFQNLPNIDPHLEPFYTRKRNHSYGSKLRDEQRGRVRSIEKSR